MEGPDPSHQRRRDLTKVSGKEGPLPAPVHAATELPADLSGGGEGWGQRWRGGAVLRWWGRLCRLWGRRGG